MSTQSNPVSGSAPRHILIAGAGIGGLSLACALRKAGLSATVFERAEVLRPVGAGITVQMNAMAALRSIGLAEAVAEAGATVTSAATLRHSGQKLAHMPFEELQREFGVPMVTIHRARLQAVLLAQAGEEHVRTDRAVKGFQDDGQKVTVELSDGSTATGDLLVGADGLHSVVRREVLGDAPLRYSGYTSWRGVAKAAALVEPGHVSETWGPGARFGIVPIGHGEVYWFATVNAPAGGKDEPGRARAHLLERFGGWHAPIAPLLEATSEEHIVRTDINDRPPVARWSKGRVTLLGDAAHPMTPNMGQGGCQAIEDAVVLAGCLAREPDVSAALATYERRRIERANSFVSRSHQFGRVTQLESSAGRFVRDTLMRLVPTSAATQQIRALMNFTP
jgi:2-polyprenyl-6-methoxyphenol hydroxylase-like FAD-dependent oxidoreductase